MKVAVWTAVVVGLLGIGWLLFHRPWAEDFCADCVLLKPHRHNSQRNPSSSLKTLATAQADYRANDRDGNGKQDFWRGDVAGLYVLRPTGDPEMIKLIELSVAGADAAPLTNVTAVTANAPKAGYWFKAIRHADEIPGKLDPQRFAFCAYPEDPSKHRSMFIVSEGNTVFRAPAVKGGADVFPDLETLKKNWSKLD